MSNFSDSTVSVMLPSAEAVIAKINELQVSLQERLPNYESLLHTIHRNLATDPDVVNILTEEQIGVIVAGLQKRTGVFIAAEVVAKVKKKTGKIGLDDL